MIRGRLVTVVSAVSLPLLIATMALWVASYSRGFYFSRGSYKFYATPAGLKGRWGRAAARQGRAVMQFQWATWHSNVRSVPLFFEGSFVAYRRGLLATDGDDPLPSAWTAFDCSIRSEFDAKDDANYAWAYLMFPLWVPSLAFAAMSVPALRYFTRFRRMHSSGSCSTCGYNLTGNTSGVCPECGTPVSNKPEAVE
jgi:hypothetical protein